MDFSLCVGAEIQENLSASGFQCLPGEVTIFPSLFYTSCSAIMAAFYSSSILYKRYKSSMGGVMVDPALCQQ